MAVLDASKVLDEVNHYALCIKLIAMSVPVYLLNVIINCHLKLSGFVNWCGVLSSMFYIKSDVRQGICQ